MSSEILEALAVTAELTGTVFSTAAAKALARDLEAYPEAQVMIALEHARQEVGRGQLTPEAIISRIPDGRPGPEEAWSALPVDEDATVVWTEETQDAWAGCKRLLQEGETVQARMAFKEIYVARVREARRSATPVKWLVSPGRDREQRRTALVAAAREGKITRDLALEYCPFVNFDTGAEGKVVALLEQPNIPPRVRESLTEILKRSSNAKAAREAAIAARKEERHRATFANPEWCREHGIRYDETA